MAEVVVMIILFTILIGLQSVNKKKIIIPAKKNKYKLMISVGLSLGILFLFWPDLLQDQLKLIILVILILNVTFGKEGLGKSKIIKSGFLDINYSNFEKVLIEPMDTFSNLTFYKREVDQNGTSLEVDNLPTDLLRFFNENSNELIVELNMEK